MLLTISTDFNQNPFLHSYIFNRYLRCNVNNSFSQWKRVLAGAPQGSILGPLLFNIFIRDLFLFLQKKESANYADDYTMYSGDKSINNTMMSLIHGFSILSNWIYKNLLFLNLGKCSFMPFGVKDELQTDLVSNNATIKNSKSEKIPGITFDNKLEFSL